MSAPEQEVDLGQAVLAALDEDIGAHGLNGEEPTDEPTGEVEAPEPPPSDEEEEGEEEEAEEVSAEEQAEEEEGEDEDAEEEDKEDEEGESRDEPLSLTFSSEDPDVLSLLSRYDNDVEKALRGQVELQRVLTRQGHDKNALSQRVQQLEQELAQAQMFATEPSFLTEEQQTWVEEAVQSGQPNVYIRQAVAAQEFALARAVAEAWGNEQPYPALRAGQMVDAAEAQAYAQMAPAVDTFETAELLQILAEHYPDLPNHEQQMVGTIGQLGEGHPLVMLARSGVPEEAARGIIGIYEIARAKSATVETTKASVKKKQKEAGSRAREDAVVSSSQSSPASTQAPRSVEIAPGLTMDQYLDELK